MSKWAIVPAYFRFQIEADGWEEICLLTRMKDIRNAKKRLAQLGITVERYNPRVNIEAYRIASLMEAQRRTKPSEWCPKCRKRLKPRPRGRTGPKKAVRNTEVDYIKDAGDCSPASSPSLDMLAVQ